VRLAPMPTPRNHHAAVVLDGRIHTIGGRVGQDFTMTTHEVYDPASDAWVAAPPLPTGRSGIAAVSLEGRMYVFGGEMVSPQHRTFNEVERFDPRAGRWEAMPTMPTARHGLGAAVIGGSIHVVSGGPQPGASFSGVHEVLTPGR
jgi:N-acetylneuraminic acid mutarotase